MKKQKILFVDDDPCLLDAMRTLFFRRFEVHTAQSPHFALDMLAAGASFPVVVADLKMPEMSGIDFFKRARAVAPESVRVMLTGQADLNAAMEAVNSGQVFRFHTKPCAFKILEQSVEDALCVFTLSQTAPPLSAHKITTNRAHGSTRERCISKLLFKKTESCMTAEEIQFLMGDTWHCGMKTTHEREQ